MRNGLNFTERGYGVRAALGCSGPRPHRGRRSSSRATSTGTRIFGKEGARWFHTGGIFAALSETTPRGGQGGDGGGPQPRHRRSPTTSTTARRSGSRSAARSGRRRSTAQLAPLVDVMLGNEEDFTAALGFEVEGVDEHLSGLDPAELPQDDRAAP